MSGIITLTTDWKNNDYYVGCFKAKLISKFPNLSFVDITHNIETYSISQAAFIVKNIYKDFPAGTIHIIAVDSEPDINGKILVIEENEQYFILNDNGSVGLIFDNKPKKIIQIETGFGFEGANFTSYFIFSKIALVILKTKDISQLGEITDDYKTFPSLLPVLGNNIINGVVIYIDSFGNAITNIHKDLFMDKVKDSKFEILLNSNHHKSDSIKNSYKQVSMGDIVCLFNSVGLLEIAIREGNASQLLNLKKEAEIRIKYNL